MQKEDEKWLMKSLLLLKEDLSLMDSFRKDDSLYDISLINGRVFCLFAELQDEYELLILLVYDKDGNVISDINGYHTSVGIMLDSTSFYDFLSEESDWMYLEHYLYHDMCWKEAPYPPSGLFEKQPEGDVLLIRNAYVTRRFRGQHLFTLMLEQIRGFALRRANGLAHLDTVISLDPDVACYGEDASQEPYIYNFQNDEPVRIQNRKILEHLGFGLITMQYSETFPEDDGTKIWFAIKRETDHIVETEIMS